MPQQSKTIIVTGEVVVDHEAPGVELSEILRIAPLIAGHYYHIFNRVVEDHCLFYSK